LSIVLNMSIIEYPDIPLANTFRITDRTAAPAPSARRASRFLQALSVDRTSLICSLFCSAVFIYWTVELTHHLSALGLAFFLLMPLTVFYLGRGLLRWLGYPTTTAYRFPLAFLAGSIIACLLLFVLDFISPLSLPGNWIALLIGTLILQLVTPTQPRTPARWEETLYAVLAVGLSLAAATLWTSDLRPFAIRQGEQVIFKPWNDYFYHAAVAAEVQADRSLLRLGSFELAGMPAGFYHYASYVFPASVSAWTGQTAFEGLASFWVPLGVFLTGLAAYCLGCSWFDNRAGLLALIGLLLAPDSSSYWPQSGFFSYHSIVMICPGLAYGIAGAALALLFVSSGVRPTRWRYLGVGFGLAAASLLLKAQVFVAVVPLLAIWVLLFKEGWTWKRRLGMALGLIVLGGTAILTAHHLQFGPTMWPFQMGRGVGSDIGGHAKVMPPVIWREHFWPFLLIGLPLGALALLCPFLLSALFLWKRLRPVDLVPVLAVLIYLAFNVLLPPNKRGERDELWHRPFVWHYFVVVAWTWGRLCSLLSASRFGRSRLFLAATVLAGFALLVAPWQLGPNVQRLQMGKARVDRPLPAGRVDCAQFVRSQGSYEDVVQEDVAQDNDWPDDFMILPGLAERRCYLAYRPTLWARIWAGTPEHRESCKRDQLLRQMRKARTADELRRFVTQTGIRWYIAYPGEELTWPVSLLEHPAFQSGGYKVYDLHTLSVDVTQQSAGYRLQGR
jgi:hypothetical protein